MSSSGPKPLKRRKKKTKRGSRDALVVPTTGMPFFALGLSPGSVLDGHVDLGPYPLKTIKRMTPCIPADMKQSVSASCHRILDDISSNPDTSVITVNDSWVLRFLFPATAITGKDKSQSVSELPPGAVASLLTNDLIFRTLATINNQEKDKSDGDAETDTALLQLEKADLDIETPWNTVESKDATFTEDDMRRALGLANATTLNHFSIVGIGISRMLALITAQAASNSLDGALVHGDGVSLSRATSQTKKALQWEASDNRSAYELAMEAQILCLFLEDMRGDVVNATEVWIGDNARRQADTKKQATEDDGDDAKRQAGSKAKSKKRAVEDDGDNDGDNGGAIPVPKEKKPARVVLRRTRSKPVVPQILPDFRSLGLPDTHEIVSDFLAAVGVDLSDGSMTLNRVWDSRETFFAKFRGTFPYNPTTSSGLGPDEDGFREAASKATPRSLEAHVEQLSATQKLVAKTKISVDSLLRTLNLIDGDWPLHTFFATRLSATLKSLKSLLMKQESSCGYGCVLMGVESTVRTLVTYLPPVLEAFASGNMARLYRACLPVMVLHDETVMGRLSKAIDDAGAKTFAGLRGNTSFKLPKRPPVPTKSRMDVTKGDTGMPFGTNPTLMKRGKVTKKTRDGAPSGSSQSGRPQSRLNGETKLLYRDLQDRMVDIEHMNNLLEILAVFPEDVVQGVTDSVFPLKAVLAMPEQHIVPLIVQTVTRTLSLGIPVTTSVFVAMEGTMKRAREKVPPPPSDPSIVTMTSNMMFLQTNLSSWIPGNSLADMLYHINASQDVFRASLARCGIMVKDMGLSCVPQPSFKLMGDGVSPAPKLSVVATAKKEGDSKAKKKEDDSKTKKGKEADTKTPAPLRPSSIFDHNGAVARIVGKATYTRRNGFTQLTEADSVLRVLTATPQCACAAMPSTVCLSTGVIQMAAMSMELETKDPKGVKHRVRAIPKLLTCASAQKATTGDKEPVVNLNCTISPLSQTAIDSVCSAMTTAFAAAKASAGMSDLSVSAFKMASIASITLKWTAPQRPQAQAINLAIGQSAGATGPAACANEDMLGSIMGSIGAAGAGAGTGALPKFLSVSTSNRNFSGTQISFRVRDGPGKPPCTINVRLFKGGSANIMATQATYMTINVFTALQLILKHLAENGHAIVSPLDGGYDPTLWDTLPHHDPKTLDIRFRGPNQLTDVADPGALARDRVDAPEVLPIYLTQAKMVELVTELLH